MLFVARAQPAPGARVVTHGSELTGSSVTMPVSEIQPTTSLISGARADASPRDSDTSSSTSQTRMVLLFLDCRGAQLVETSAMPIPSGIQCMRTCGALRASAPTLQLGSASTLMGRLVDMFMFMLTSRSSRLSSSVIASRIALLSFCLWFDREAYRPHLWSIFSSLRMGDGRRRPRRSNCRRR